jgi:hypothetical protein
MTAGAIRGRRAGLPHGRQGAGVLALVLAFVLTACSGAPFSMTAVGPWTYSTAVAPPFQRVAVLVTITNLSGDDLDVNPADFVARDATHHIYPANPADAVTDAQAVQQASADQRGVQGVVPLPTVTLRQSDVLSGFVVFEVPTGVRLTELIWRQSDTDYVVPLAGAR